MDSDARDRASSSLQCDEWLLEHVLSAYSDISRESLCDPHIGSWSADSSNC